MSLKVYDFLGVSGAGIGVNYGRLGNNLPSVSKSIELIQSIKSGGVKFYDQVPEILNALKGTNLTVTVMVPNELIANMSSNQSMADEWVRTNVLPYLPTTRIKCVLVGNEILSLTDATSKKNWFNLVPCMKKVQFALKTLNLTNIKVGTTMAMDVISTVFPPSNASFRADIALSVMKPMLNFLNKTKSYYFVDVYPYFVWSQNYPNISLDYALLNGGGANYTDPVSNLTYTNLLDQMLDSVVFSMKKLSVPNLRLWIAETGWPNSCDIDQIGGNHHNAATYNRNLVQKLTKNPPIGTPARPGEAFPAFLFSLYNENQKPGPATERHWGVFYPNTTAVYPIDLSGSTQASQYPDIPQGDNNVPYKGKIWCVLARGANMSALGSALAYACSQGNGTCDALQPGRECYRPNLTLLHANYAFSSYWARLRSQGATCFFNGLAVQSTKDPSNGSCFYPSVTLS
ncbi:hypothetical protein V2J09_005022 [Rumex salicifolius]